MQWRGATTYKVHVAPTLFLLALFAAAVLGGIFPLAVRESSRALHLLLCIAAGFFIGTVFLHLLPELSELAAGDSVVWTWVLVGLLAVLVLDLGIFGHQSHAAVGWATLLGLGVHAAMMGLSLGMLASVSVLLAWGLLAHKFGETFSLVSALRLSVQKRSLLIALLTGFSLVTPLAMLLGSAIRESVPEGFHLVVSALAAGSFLYVAVGDILPEVFHDSRDRGAKIVLLLTGTAFAALASVGHVHGDEHAHPHAGEGGEAGEAGKGVGAAIDHSGHDHSGHDHASHAELPADGTALASVDTPAEFVWALLVAAWDALAAAAPFLLVGFFVAGLIKVYLPKDLLTRAMGRDDLPSILRASVVGAPLPLCSCSVLPTAIGLRKSGASKSATVAFLVSTPETGIDSVAVSAALLDPYLTVARPVGAVLSATAAGVATKFVVAGEDEIAHAMADDARALSTAEPSSTQADGASGLRASVPNAGSCCGAPQEAVAPRVSALAGDTAPAPRDPGLLDAASSSAESCCATEDAVPRPLSTEPASKLGQAVRFGFGRLFDDIVPSLLIGILLAALFALLLPAELLAGAWGSGLSGLFVAALIGLPVYVCASASTPVAAVLLAKGLSPGAALVFLLVGPATNLASILVLRKELGTRVVATYVTTVVVVALLLGALTNFIYGAWSLPAPVDAGHEHGTSVIGAVAASVLLALALLSFVRHFRGLAEDPVLDESAEISSAQG